MPRKGELRVDLTGRTFGRLTVIGFSSRSVRRRALWLCGCLCGITTVIDGANLRSGNSTSCGCLQAELTAERSLSHGHNQTGNRSPEYHSWTSMWARVRDRKGRRFRDYGARGITACERWLSFENFLADMGPRPEGMTLDRINVDGNYEPANCRWATVATQNANQRRYLKKSHPQSAAQEAQTS